MKACAYRSLSCIFSPLAMLFALPIFLVLSGCGGASFHSNSSSSAPAPTVSITASPVSISAGSSSMLTVAATNASAVVVSGSDGSSYNLSTTGGTQAVSPTATTTYTANVTGTGGKASSAVSVTVVAAAAPTVTIVASPTSITAGSSSTLTVAATNATAVTITGSDGSTYKLQPSGGTQAVSPTTTASYTATANGAGGKASASTTVSVTAAATANTPTVAISANPKSINSGGSSTLTVTATNATAVTVTGSDGSSYKLSASGGTQAVSPSATTTYTANATGAGGTASAVTTVTVAAAPTVTISASPKSINAGSSSSLTVTATNATMVTVTGSDGSSYKLPASGGTQAVSPTSTTTYTANAAGAGGTASAVTTVTVAAAPTVTIAASPTSITVGNSSTLTVVATNAATVVVTGTDGSSYDLPATGGTQAVSPSATTTYTATATGNGSASATATVTVTPQGSIQSINHVVFMLQENHTFDNYFGMLNPYRVSQGWNVGDDGKTYTVDGIDDKLSKSAEDDEGTSITLFKLKSSCIDDDSSDWLASYGDVNRYDFLATRPIQMNGFVHTAEGFAKNCASTGSCSGSFTDLHGQRAMGYYDQGFLNYYYYMASQFAVSNRWFSPVASKSVPNRIATFTGGTTQGLVLDPGGNDKLPQLAIPTIFNELDKAKVSWKIYYTVTQGYCLESDDCGTSGNDRYPATAFSNLTYSFNYLRKNASNQASGCTAPLQPSSVVGDSTNSFCIDPNKIAPLSQYYSDLSNGTLPSFAFIETGYGASDEHPGSGNSVLVGQAEVASVMNAFMASPEWNDSVFFFSYDEGGGPYDHVPPVSGHSNDFTDSSLGVIPDISTIAVNPDGYQPCLPADGTPTTHCDLHSDFPGVNPGDAPAVHGFDAQLGFRLPNMVVSPFTRRHYVSNIPMDHTAILKFVETRFIGGSEHLNPHDAAQPSLLDFFDFSGVPWATPPTPPAPVTSESLGYNPCTPASLQ